MANHLQFLQGVAPQPCHTIMQGNQTTLADPDAGTSTYTYDAYGRLTYQVDGKGNETWLYYDNLGRVGLYRRTKMEKLPITPMLHQGTGKNKLLRESRGNTWKTYGYDTYGRVNTTTEHVSNAISNQVYQYAYNANNDITGITYPSGLVVTNVYDTHGYLSSITAGGQYHLDPLIPITG